MALRPSFEKTNKHKVRVVFPESNVNLIAVMSLTTSEWTLLMTGTFVSGDTAALLARVHQFIHTSIL